MSNSCEVPYEPVGVAGELTLTEFDVPAWEALVAQLQLPAEVFQGVGGFVTSDPGQWAVRMMNNWDML